MWQPGLSPVKVRRQRLRRILRWIAKNILAVGIITLIVTNILTPLLLMAADPNYTEEQEDVNDVRIEAPLQVQWGNNILVRVIAQANDASQYYLQVDLNESGENSKMVTGKELKQGTTLVIIPQDIGINNLHVRVTNVETFAEYTRQKTLFVLP